MADSVAEFAGAGSRWCCAAAVLSGLVASNLQAEDKFQWSKAGDGLLPAVSPQRSQPEKLTPPPLIARPVKQQTDAAATSSDSLRRSRLLLNQLRNSSAKSVETPVAANSVRPQLRNSEVPGPVPPVPHPDEVAAALDKAAAVKATEHKAAVAEVVKVSAAGDEVGVVTIPSVLPPESIPAIDVTDPAEGEIEPTGRRKIHGQKVPKKRKTFTADGRVIVENFRKGTTKIREAGCWLVEYCDPEVFDEDEYHMPIVLVGGTDEPPAERPAGSGLLARSLTDIQPTLNYAWGTWEDDELPEDFHERMDNGVYVKRYNPQTVLQWAPTNLWYHPLYFQDVGLERYGHTHKPWVQPFVSSGKFFGQFVGLPYQMVLHPPKSREFALGYYQPGEWAPKKKLAIPWNEEAAATEFLWVTGIILLIP